MQAAVTRALPPPVKPKPVRAGGAAGEYAMLVSMISLQVTNGSIELGWAVMQRLSMATAMVGLGQLTCDDLCIPAPSLTVDPNLVIDNMLGTRPDGADACLKSPITGGTDASGNNIPGWGTAPTAGTS